MADTKISDLADGAPLVATDELVIARTGSNFKVDPDDIVAYTFGNSSFTQGSVFFTGASGTILEDNTNFFWDNANDRLGIGTAAPATRLHVLDTVDDVEIRIITDKVDGNAFIKISNDVQSWQMGVNNSDQWTLNNNTASTNPFLVNPGAVNQAIFMRNAEIVFNDAAQNYDVRIETQLEPNAFVMDASAETATFNVDTTVNGTFTATNYIGLSLGPLFVQTVDAVVANTTTETTLVSTGIGSVTIPAANLIVGAKFIIKAQGIITDSGNPSFQMRVKLDSVVIGDTGSNSLGAISDDHWVVDVEFVVRTEGATGTIASAGSFLTSQDDHFALVNTSTIVIDTTVDQTLDITAEWGTASASNTITAQLLELEEINVFP